MRETPALDDDPLLHHGSLSTAAGRHIGTGGDGPPRVRAVFNLLRD